MLITIVWSAIGFQLQIDTRRKCECECEEVEEEEEHPEQMLPATGTVHDSGRAEPPYDHMGFRLPSTEW